MTIRTTDFSQRFQLRLPLILAPLSGGPSTPELVAAVCNAGGLGSLGLAYAKPTEIEATTSRLRTLTSKPFAINLFVPTKDPEISAESLARAMEATKKYREELGLPVPRLETPYSENFDEQFTAMIKARPSIFSFTFGVLEEKYLHACRENKIYVIGTATTPEEALQLQKSGVDAVALQGVEGGGHRGIFDASIDDPNISALELTQICSRSLRIPVLTAGGLMNGQDIDTVLKAGAQAAQLGTAFLTCDEAATSKPYRRALLEEKNQTKLTRAFSGRWARGLPNKFMLEMEMKKDSIMLFPAQNKFTRDIRNASTANDKSDYLSLWAGTGHDQVRPMKAADLVEQLYQELKNT